MPTKTRPKTTARPTRKSIKKRSAKEKQGCKGSDGNKTDGPRIIANSVFALTLTPKRGIETVTESGPFDHEVTVIVEDLNASLNRALLLLKKKRCKYNPIAAGLSVNEAMLYCIDRFEKEILPSGYSFNIDYSNESGYHFTIYKQVNFKWAWHIFPLRKAVRQLESNEGLYSIFIQIIKALIRNCEFGSWWNGSLYYYDMLLFDTEQLQALAMDRAENEEDEMKIWEELKRTADEYRSGKPKQIINLIDRSRPLHIPSAVDKLEKSRSPFAKWMLKAIDLISDNQCLSNFQYESDREEEYSDHPVALSYQVLILWDDDDEVFHYEEQSIDSEASNFGVEEAVVHLPITRNNRFIPLKTLPTAEKWMHKITELFYAYHDIYQKLKK